MPWEPKSISPILTAPGSEEQTKENTNGLLRQFFPKGKSMTQVSYKDVDAAVRLLNDRP